MHRDKITDFAEARVGPVRATIQIGADFCALVPSRHQHKHAHIIHAIPFPCQNTETGNSD
jgi:hypothetical protein